LTAEDEEKMENLRDAAMRVKFQGNTHEEHLEMGNTLFLPSPGLSSLHFLQHLPPPHRPLHPFFFSRSLLGGFVANAYCAEL